MNCSSLPTEILADIIEEFVTKCVDSSQIRFTPRWYLLPLLQVSKQWNALCTKHMYQSVEIGNAAPFVFPAREDESCLQTEDRRLDHILHQRTREGEEVAKEFYETLSSNSWLAGLVERLQFGMDLNRYSAKSNWTVKMIDILKVCPNVRHVEVFGFEDADLDALVNVLKEKSLVSFYITPLRIADVCWKSTGRGEGGNSFQIFDMMRSWPSLQSAHFDKFLTKPWMENPLTLDISNASGRCPNVHEIVITKTALKASELTLLRTMCTGGLTTLSLATYFNKGFMDELVKCFRTWSSTLRYLKIHNRDLGSISSQTIEQAICTLTELRELQVQSSRVIISGMISSLPWLERYACISLFDFREVTQSFLSHLECSESFPSLNHIVVHKNVFEQHQAKLRNTCSRRNIALDVFDGFLPTDFVI